MAVRLVRQRITHVTVSDVKQTLIVRFEVTSGRLRAYTHTQSGVVVVSSSHGHRPGLDSMCYFNLLHSNLVYQSIPLAQTYRYLRIMQTLCCPRTRLLMCPAAHACIIASIAVGVVSSVVMLLHCRPIKYNYTMPFEDPKHCYKLGPFILAMATLGVAMDALTWLLPHYVVWRLQLPLAHRLAITAIFAFGLMFTLP